MSFAKIKGKLSSRIGRPVHFGPPEDVKRKGGGAGAGTIIDEVWADPDLNDAPPHKDCDGQCWGDYSFCSQLIRWDDGAEVIRLAYYRRLCGEDFWEFAAQMTPPPNQKLSKSGSIGRSRKTLGFELSHPPDAEHLLLGWGGAVCGRSSSAAKGRKSETSIP